MAACLHSGPRGGVSDAGALGGIAVGASDAASARAMIGEVRGATARPFNVNVFVHAAARSDPIAKRRGSPDWPRRSPLRSGTASCSPADLPELQRRRCDACRTRRRRAGGREFPFRPSACRPCSGTPRARRDAHRLRDQRRRGCAGRARRLDAVVAQGSRLAAIAGLRARRARRKLGTLVLTRLLVQRLHVPVIAAGGIMDGAGISPCSGWALSPHSWARRSSPARNRVRAPHIGRHCSRATRRRRS